MTGFESSFLIHGKKVLPWRYCLLSLITCYRTFVLNLNFSVCLFSSFFKKIHTAFPACISFVFVNLKTVNGSIFMHSHICSLFSFVSTKDISFCSENPLFDTQALFEHTNCLFPRKLALYTSIKILLVKNIYSWSLCDLQFLNRK